MILEKPIDKTEKEEGITNFDKLRSKLVELPEIKNKITKILKYNLKRNLELAKETWPGLLLQGGSFLLLVSLAERNALPTQWLPDSFFVDGLFAEPGSVPEELKALAIRDIMFFASALAGPAITDIYKSLKTRIY